jgi:hypothetical protein
MPIQLPAVLSTYATRRSVQLLVALGGAFCLLVPLAMLIESKPTSQRPTNDIEEVLGLLALPTMIFAYLIASQGKWQFADPRSRLVPNFVANHLAVLACLALLSLGLAPALLGWAARASALGAAATSIAIGASLIWLIQGKPAQSLLFGFGTTALMIRPGVAFWLAPDSAAAHWPYQLALLAAGWAAFGSWLVRLANICEEQSDYFQPVYLQAGSATRIDRRQANHAAARLFANSSCNSLSWLAGDKRLDSLVGIRAATAAERQRLLRYGASPESFWGTAVGVAAPYAFLICFTPMFRSMGVPPAPTYFFIGVIPMSALIAPGILLLRRSRMPQEVLLPLTRRSYFDGLFAAMVRKVVVTWAIANPLLLATIALMIPQTMSIAFALALTAVTLSAYLCAFGVLAWLAQIRSTTRRLLITCLVGIPAVVFLNAGVDAITVKSPPPPLPATIAALREKPLSAERRAKVEQAFHRHEEQVRQSRHTNPRFAWSAAASLSAIGAICAVVSRRKWLDVELA